MSFTRTIVRPLESVLPSGDRRTTGYGRSVSFGRFVLQPFLIAWYWSWLLLRYGVGYDKNRPFVAPEGNLKILAGDVKEKFGEAKVVAESVVVESGYSPVYIDEEGKVRGRRIPPLEEVVDGYEYIDERESEKMVEDLGEGGGTYNIDVPKMSTEAADAMINAVASDLDLGADVATAPEMADTLTTATTQTTETTITVATPPVATATASSLR